MFCGNQSAVKHGEGYRQAITLRCRSWTCPECQPKRRRQLIAQAIGGEPNTFITLTLPAERAQDAEDAVKDLSRAWRIIRKRDARRRKAKPIPFLAVVEKTKNGTPHLHIICRAKWIDWKWLSNCMDEIADAPVVDIRRIDAKGRVAGYCAKYVGKDTAKVGSNKRYWQSRDYPVHAQPTKSILLEGEFWSRPWQMSIRRTVAEFEGWGWKAEWLSSDKAMLWPPDE